MQRLQDCSHASSDSHHRNVLKLLNRLSDIQIPIDALQSSRGLINHPP